MGHLLQSDSTNTLITVYVQNIKIMKNETINNKIRYFYIAVITKCSVALYNTMIILNLHANN